MDVFTFNNGDFKFDVPCSNVFSKFDSTLKSLWDQKMDDGVFRYKLNIKKDKSLGDKFYLQLNVDRASHRRKPARIDCINQPFDPKVFNFTQIKEIEKLFYISNEDREDEDGHILLIPNLEERLPQILTEEALQLAVEMILLSGTSVGFNSLGGFASVNHLHIHGYYLRRCMYLEKVPVKVIIHPCYRIMNFPSKGFVFQIKCKEEIEFIVKNVFKLVNFLQSSNISHNMYITRAIPFNTEETNSRTRDSLRIYVWPRKSEYGAKNLSNLNAATCELFGHLVIKNEQDYDTLTEDDIVNILEDLTTESFENVVENITGLFSL